MKITNKLSIQSIETGTIEGSIESTEITDFHINMKFYDCEYDTHIDFQSLVDDESYNISISGDTDLFESFEEQVQLHFSSIKYHIIKWAKDNYDDLIIPPVTVELQS